MFLIIGLGNPGPEYDNTRHNLGSRAVDLIAKELGAGSYRSQCKALLAQAEFGGHKVLLAKPQTFMNLSGESVQEVVRWYKIDLKHLILVHDDLDIDPGKIKIARGGSDAGHKGVASVIEKLNTTDFSRVRIGIGRKTLGGDNSDYVLQRIHPADRTLLEAGAALASEASLAIVKDGVEAAMNLYNW